MQRVAENLNYNVIKNLLFIHAWSGCDTTSATFNQGKTTLMKFIANSNAAILDVCAVFDSSDASREEIGNAGLKLFVHSYGMYHFLLLYLLLKEVRNHNYKANIITNNEFKIVRSKKLFKEVDSNLK